MAVAMTNTTTELERDLTISQKGEVITDSRMIASLHQAAISGNIPALESADLKDQLTANNNTLLHIASQFGQAAAVETILSKHPSLLSQANSGGETALHLAAKCGHISVVRVLLDYARRKPEDEDEDIESGLSTLQFFLRITNRDEETALHVAVRFNRYRVVTTLLNKYPDYPHSANKTGETLLYMAASRGFYKLVDVILTKCVWPPYGGPNGRTALHGAVISKKFGRECIEKLVDWKISLIKETDLCGQTPLHYAALIGDANKVKQLLCSDETVAYVADNDDKNTALHIAASQGNVDVVREFLSHCPGSWDMVNVKGRNILHIAVEHEKVELIEFIVKKCQIISSLITQKDVHGNTPLHLLASRDHWLPNLIQHTMADKGSLNNQNLTPSDLVMLHVKDRKKSSMRRICFLLKLASPTLCLPNLTSTEGEMTTTTDKYSFDYEEKALARSKTWDTDMIVAALIATITFTAGFTMPGGIDGNQGPNQGRAVLAREAAFKVFIIADTLSLVFSSCAVLVCFMASHDRIAEDIPASRRYCVGLIGNALAAMMVAFIAGTYAVLAHSSALAIATSIVACFFFWVFFPVMRWRVFSMLSVVAESFFMWLIPVYEWFGF